MTPGQTAIQVNEAAPTVGRCGWCGSVATKKITLTKPRYTAKTGIRRIIKPAQEAWACDDHYRTVQRTEDGPDAD